MTTHVFIEENKVKDAYGYSRKPMIVHDFPIISKIGDNIYKYELECPDNHFSKNIIATNVKKYLVLDTENEIRSDNPVRLDNLRKLFLVRKKYDISNPITDYNTPDIANFIKLRGSLKKHVLPWRYQKISDSHVFDLKLSKFHPTRLVGPVFYDYFGGIIVTNNIPKLISDNFPRYNNTKTLIIKPDNVNIHASSENSRCINFDQIRSIGGKQFDSVFIHELYSDNIRAVRKLEFSSTTEIWIINSMPIHNYFSDMSVIGNISKYIRVYFKKQSDRKLKKYNMINHSITEFYDIYSEHVYDENISTVVIGKRPIENILIKEYMSKYSNWFQKLSNDQNNIYSTTTFKENKSVVISMKLAILTLLSSHIQSDNLDAFFSDKMEIFLDKLSTLRTCCSNCLEKYREVNKMVPVDMINLYDNLPDDIINMTSDAIGVIDSKIAGLNTLRSNDVYKLCVGDNCPVCFEKCDFLCVYICGHRICLECAISCIAENSCCPLCKIQITMADIVVINQDGTMPDNFMSDMFNNISDRTIIFSDFDIKYCSISSSMVNILSADVMNLELEREIDFVTCLLIDHENRNKMLFDLGRFQLVRNVKYQIYDVEFDGIPNYKMQ